MPAPTTAPILHSQSSITPLQLNAKNPFSTYKEQRSFEKAIWEKTRRASGESFHLDTIYLPPLLKDVLLLSLKAISFCTIRI